MKIFESTGRINFVDDNNVFVGFDYSQSCCESFGYFFCTDHTRSAETRSTLVELDVSRYNFDTGFYVRIADAGESIEDGGTCFFKLTSNAGSLYLGLYNYHNGYYGHGFEMVINEKIIQEGCL